MEEERIATTALRVDDPRRDAMKTPEEVAAMLRLKGLGGRSFASWEAFEAHLDAWTREVADRRVLVWTF